MKSFENCYEEQLCKTVKYNLERDLESERRKRRMRKIMKIIDIAIFVLFATDIIFLAMWIDETMNVCEKDDKGQVEIEAFEPIKAETNYFEVPCPAVTPDGFYSSVENVNAHSAVFKVTHYCGCSKCCGNYSDGSESVAYGASGKRLEAFVSVAVDPSVIPLGTVLHDAEGRLYRAEDTGGAIKGNRIDLFVGDHQEALNMGVKEIELFW